MSLRLDVRYAARLGWLEFGRSTVLTWKGSGGEQVGSVRLVAVAGGVRLRFSHARDGEDRRHVDQPVSLARTSCALGGQREWWTCSGCGRRAAVLHLSGCRFACRHCQGLTAYRSQRETQGARDKRRLDKLRKRLGWTPGIFSERGGRPKDMHWRTYFALCVEHDALGLKVLAGLSAKAELAMQRMDAALAMLAAPLRRKVLRGLHRRPRLAISPQD